MHPLLFGAGQNCLHLKRFSTISNSYLVACKRFNQFINSTVFKYFTNQCSNYSNEIFESVCLNDLRTRNSYLKLIYPF